MSLSGRIFSFTQLDSQFKKPEINTQIEIIYDEIDPSNAIINNKMSRKFIIVKLVVLAIFSIFLLTMLIKTLINSF